VSWEIFLLGVLGAVGWYWYTGMQAREQAIAAGRHSCSVSGIQFLDESVALSRIRLARNGSGQLQLQRDYRFEFSDTGNNRRPGVIRMLGNCVEWINLDGEWQPGRTASVSRLMH
jgi:hypothetical protein